MRHLWRQLLLVTSLGLMGTAACAQIKIGQTAGFTGPVAAGVKEITDGAKLYLDAVNAKGGINGQAIELVSLDDKFEPKLAAENAKKLIDDGVIALFLSRGTPHSQAILPLLEQHKLTLIAPSTGAMALHQPVNPWVFNVRATYQREAEKAIQHLFLIGMQRVAIIQVDDSFGADAAIGALKGFEALKKQPALHEKYDRSKPDFSKIVPKVVAADAQAVLFIGSLSNNASSGFVKSLKDNARGTIISQVFPYERSLAAPIVKEAHDLALAKGQAEVTPAMLEGFAAAKVLVEGLRRAGKDLSRTGVQKALEGMQKVNIGGLDISYGPKDHTGLDYAELSIVGADGRFRR